MNTSMTAFDIAGPLPSGTTLVEASAGTGKTWTVAALVTRYVAERGIPLSQMLVVTFSRAASQELRERVRDMLDHTVRRLDAPPQPGDDALIEHLRAGTPEEVAERRLRLRAALADFDTATIATIHQFCQYVLRGLGVAGDSDSFAGLTDDLEQLREDVISDVYLARQRAGGFTMSYEIALEAAHAALKQGTAPIAPNPPPPDLTEMISFVTDVRQEYARRKRRAAVLEYDDLLSELASALHQPNSVARTRMRERWSVVLVDEFQDTDPVQWDVFRSAFGEGGEALVLIGDPKQAIYGFRGGDVQTYLQASRTARTRLSLPTNFRSDGPLVEALGVLLDDVHLSEGIVARPITAARPDSRVDTSAPPIDLRYLMDEPLTVGPARAIAAQDAAAEIATMLQDGSTFEGRALTPHDIAVLTHRTADLMTVRAQLRRLGIPAVLVSSESVLHTEAASWWLQLLMAMEQPGRSERVRAAALTPFLGWSAEQLDGAGDAGTDAVATRIRTLIAAFTRGGIAAVLDVARENGLTARVLREVGGERDLTDIEHCGQLLGERVLEGTSGLTSLVTWLREHTARDAVATADARVMRLESDALAVTLSTIHGSKGLQYPVVLTPFLWDCWVPGPKAPAIIHDERGRVLSYSLADVTRPEHRRDALAENMRLMYVAMTRAQSRLVLWWIPTKQNTRPSGLHRLLFGQGATAGELEALLSRRVAVRGQAGTANPHTESSSPLAADRFLGKDELEAVLAAWERFGAFRATMITPRPDVRGPEPQAPTGELTGRRFDPRTVVDAAWRRTSYSALAAAGEQAALTDATSEPESEDVTREDEMEIVLSPPEPSAEDAMASPMADLPMGATFGSLVHGVLEEADLQAEDLRSEFLTRIEALQVLWPVELDRAELAEALVAVCETPLGDLADEVTLREIRPADRLPEMDFELPLAGGDNAHPHATLSAMAQVLRRHLKPGDPLLPYADELESPGLGSQPLRGYLTGSIDLTFRHGGRFHVVDYKTNRLGDPERPLTLADYAPERLVEAMNHSSYPLQALLYAVVLHRYLRWRLPGYDPQKHLGGVMYLYVRGMAGAETPRSGPAPHGVFVWQPPVALVEDLSAVLDGLDREETR